MKVLVTGGAGFIGRHIVAELTAENYDVAILDYNCSQLHGSTWGKVSCHSLDITEETDEIFKLEKPDIVIHLAAQVDVNRSLDDPKSDADTNILGTINILNNCKRHHVKKIIFASSAAVYGEPVYLGLDEAHPLEPVSFYGISKLSAEKYVKSFSELHKINYTVLRYSNVYGQTSNLEQANDVVSIFLNRMKNNQPPVVYDDGTQTRDYIYVKDVAAATVAAIHQGKNKIFNISTNTSTSINELVALLNSHLGTSLAPAYQDGRTGEIKNSYLDNGQALKQLKWKVTYPLEEGLRSTFSHF
ncbi:NAD-dependent epimerase/dehydratase family protein [Virgibacillus flavescens]|uniref:NAD-dependent epimerase/dehydratase family protein n=1 Tax=Virgibacillus flavescens TaxID=1611422 RepID=UPI003D345B2F